MAGAGTTGVDAGITTFCCGKDAIFCVSVLFGASMFGIFFRTVVEGVIDDVEVAAGFANTESFNVEGGGVIGDVDVAAAGFVNTELASTAG